MLAKRIIPCLDVNLGRVVKGTNFVNLRDAGSATGSAVEWTPTNMARPDLSTTSLTLVMLDPI